MLLSIEDTAAIAGGIFFKIIILIPVIFLVCAVGYHIYIMITKRPTREEYAQRARRYNAEYLEIKAKQDLQKEKRRQEREKKREARNGKPTFWDYVSLIPDLLFPFASDRYRDWMIWRELRRRR